MSNKRKAQEVWLEIAGERITLFKRLSYRLTMELVDTAGAELSAGVKICFTDATEVAA